MHFHAPSFNKSVDEGANNADPHQNIKGGEQLTGRRCWRVVTIANCSEGNDAKIVRIQYAPLFNQVVEDGAAKQNYNR